jgi:hypothetical protein
MTDGPHRRRVLGLVGSVAMVAARSPKVMAQSRIVTRIDFENAELGNLPEGFTGALSGSGAAARWAIVNDAEAPAGGKALAQIGADRTDYRFPLAILDARVPADLDVSVRFKPVDGEIDRAAGLVVRLIDRNNYYVARANALENNIRLYRVVSGQRSQFAGTSATVPSGRWQDLRMRIVGNRFEVFFEGRSLYTATDGTFASAGRVGLWTKADSVTYFDDLNIWSVS